MNLDLTKLSTTPDLSFKPASETAPSSFTSGPTAFDTLLASYRQPVQQPATSAAADAASNTDTAPVPPMPPATEPAKPVVAQAKPAAKNADAKVTAQQTSSTTSQPAPKTVQAVAQKAASTPQPTAKAATEVATTTVAKTAGTQKLDSLFTGLAALVGSQAPVAATPAVAAPGKSGTLAIQADGKGGKATAKPTVGKPQAPLVGTDDDGDNDQDTANAADEAKTAFDAALNKVRGQADTSGSSSSQDKNSAADQTSAQPVQAAALPATNSNTPAQAFSLAQDTVVAPTYTAAGAQSNAAATTMSQTAVDAMSQLSMQISKRLDDGSTKFAMELHPADLGRVDVTLTIGADGKTTAHLNFDSPVTAATFSAHEGELRDQLSQTGLSVASDGLSFSSRTDATTGALAQNTNQTGQNLGQSAGQSTGQGASQYPQDTPRQPVADTAMPSLDTASEADIDTYLARLNTRSSQGNLALNLLV